MSHSHSHSQSPVKATSSPRSASPSPKKPKRFTNHSLVDDTESDVESDAGQTTTASERDPLTGRRRRRSSETSAFYKCDDRGRPIASSPETRSAKRRLYIACFLAVAFFFLELAAGIISGSLALLSDSFHLLSDVAGFIISLVAIHLAEMPATSTYSYGFHRVEILGAILSTSLIWALTAGLVWEAIQRVQNPAVVDGKMMAITAGIGVGVNILLAVVLGGHGHSHGPGGHGHDHGHDHGGKKTVESPVTYGALEEGHGGHSHDEGSGHDHEHDHDHEEPSNGAHDHDFSHEKKWSENINVSSAAIHVIGDIVSSVGVLIAGIVVYFYPEWTIVDPICTFIFSLAVLLTTFRIINTTVLILLEATPHDIDPTLLERDLRLIPGVVDVHELHLWSLTVGKSSMSVHLACLVDSPEEHDRILSHAQQKVCSKYGIHHTTIQIENTTIEEEGVGSGKRRFTAHCGSSICSTGTLP